MGEEEEEEEEEAVAPAQVAEEEMGILEPVVVHGMPAPAVLEEVSEFDVDGEVEELVDEPERMVQEAVPVPDQNEMDDDSLELDGTVKQVVEPVAEDLEPPSWEEIENVDLKPLPVS